ncbi:uncharacterized protein TNCV_3026621 [Trichonephila clavipes]|nr:uncharacterized protein TNCV_3026621 [Trichonephila clavipes]
MRRDSNPCPTALQSESPTRNRMGSGTAFTYIDWDFNFERSTLTVCSTDCGLEETPQALDGVENFLSQQKLVCGQRKAHFRADVGSALDRAYPGQWIGRGGPVNWPSRSNDLSCLDFFLWGHMKSLVYASPVNSDEALGARIIVVAGEIQEMQMIFANVRHFVHRWSENLIRSIRGITNWSQMKEHLLNEFSDRINSAQLHKMMQARRLKPTETLQEYFLTMRDLAHKGAVDDSSSD